MWLKLDGLTEQFAVNVREYLTTKFGVRCIGRRCPVTWPARSPDLRQLDFFVWAHIESRAYMPHVELEDKIVQRIIGAADHIRTMNGLFRNLCQPLYPVCNVFITAGVVSLEQFL
ncbi:hypothetical protein PR048_008872 [Dryococelus australis]|uniref:Uncharacterized protein n=1 Tax=Dryococelus australis TaxID=614101 RepID=A0ABQ9I053_9NEOP|nr:hypothetical protein PR048_008872 [Dryococelus australis]